MEYGKLALICCILIENFNLATLMARHRDTLLTHYTGNSNNQAKTRLYQ
jgi:hypothetical protein